MKNATKHRKNLLLSRELERRQDAKQMVACGERCARATLSCTATVTNQTKIVIFKVEPSIGWVKNATTRGTNFRLSREKEKRTDALRMVTCGDP